MLATMLVYFHSYSDNAFMLSWMFFKHYLLSRRAGSLIRTISWICIGGVAIGIFSLFIIINVMNGFNKAIRSRLLAVEPHLVAEFPQGTLVGEVIGSSLMGFLKAQPGLQAHVFESHDAIIKTLDGLYSDAVAQGLDSESIEYILKESQRVALEGGVKIDLDSEWFNLDAGEILIGVDLARSLGLFEGDSLLIVPPEMLLLPMGEMPKYERVTIAGIVSTRVQQIDSRMIYYARGKTLQSLVDSSSRQVGIEIRLLNPENYHFLKEQILNRGVKVQTWLERNSSLFYALKIEKTTITTFMMMGVVIAGCSVLTVLLLLLTQKKQDIGILMTLGLSPFGIKKIFIQVGCLLSGLGIFLGTFFGLGLSLILEKYPLFLLPDVYYETKLPVKVDWSNVGFILVFAIFMSYVGTWLPVHSQLKFSPAEAIRKK